MNMNLLTPVLVIAALTAPVIAHDGQAGDLTVERRTLTSAAGIEIQADFCRLIVPENRNKPDSNPIELVFARLRSLADQPAAPLVYLAGGPGSSSSHFADDPRTLDGFMPILEVCDVIFLDQRGTGRSSPNLRYTPENLQPQEVFLSEEAAMTYLIEASRQTKAHWERQGVDLAGYTTVQNAEDLNDLRVALGVERLSLLGFSYGTHLALATIKRHGEHLENVIACGVEGLHETYKLPSTMDTQFRKLSMLAAQDDRVGSHVPDLVGLLERVCAKLDREPMTVEVTDPVTRETVLVPVGSFGLKMILRFDMGDASDLRVFPRLLHSIDQGDSTILRWFVQKRYGTVRSINAMTFVMDSASGASPERLMRIEAEAARSLFGNVMNMPILQVAHIWEAPDLGSDFRGPIVSNVRTLFLTGTLDWNTPPHQAEMVRWGMPNATHLIVENAGHEQILSQPAIRAAIVRFLKGEDVSDVHVKLPALRFVPIDEYDPQVTHPSVPWQ